MNFVFRFVPAMLLMLLATSLMQAQDESAETYAGIDSTAAMISQIEASLEYQTGLILLLDGMAELRVPDGYKFLNADQSQFVLSQLWGNPPDSSTLGLLFPVNMSPLSDSFTYAIEISYVEEGHIKDEDAQDINYDELLEGMQKDAEETNEARIEAGYAPVTLVGWAAPPFYDQANKKLHWAKELKFGESEVNTLNYNIRVLGRRGYLMLNAIGDIPVLPMIQQDVDKVLASVTFTEGNRYDDFDAGIDKVAAYGIGGLIAGKVLAKAGFFALLVKGWKVIALGAVAAFAAIRRFFTGKSGDSQQ
ncbi:MAG: DUF2167 domain-containing protein [Bacteroidia bacterium]|nr:DUF2167 domain-containing protein [Bacteroidia bacterium]